MAVKDEWPYGALPGVDVTIDTRQKAGKHEHVDGWLARHGVRAEYTALGFGDYMALGSNVSVDTKQHVEELAADVRRDHDRFRRECERAAAAGFRLVILVEGVAGVNDPPALVGWLRRRCAACGRCDWREARACRFHRVTVRQGASIVKAMGTMGRRYGVRLMFCPRGETARTVCELLGVRYRWRTIRGCRSSAGRRWHTSRRVSRSSRCT